MVLVVAVGHPLRSLTLAHHSEGAVEALMCALECDIALQKLETLRLGFRWGVDFQVVGGRIAELLAARGTVVEYI